MNSQTEEQLNRLTIVGWFVVATNAGTFAVMAPVLLFAICPGVLEIGGRITGYALVGTTMICGWPCFLMCKWLLEKCGVTVLRPPPPCPRDRPEY